MLQERVVDWTPTSRLLVNEGLLRIEVGAAQVKALRAAGADRLTVVAAVHHAGTVMRRALPPVALPRQEDWPVALVVGCSVASVVVVAAIVCAAVLCRRRSSRRRLYQPIAGD